MDPLTPAALPTLDRRADRLLLGSHERRGTRTSAPRRAPHFQCDETPHNLNDCGRCATPAQQIDLASTVAQLIDRWSELSDAGKADASGKYKLTTNVAGDGAQEGEYRVKVTKYDPKYTKEEQQQHIMTMEEEQKMVFTGSDLPVPPAKNLLPKKYENETTSGLTHTVPKGPSTLDTNVE